MEYSMCEEKVRDAAECDGTDVHYFETWDLSAEAEGR
jgi:hypothetical protein